MCYASSYDLSCGVRGMGSVSLRLPDDLEQKLDREAELAGCPRSEIMRDALIQLIRLRERERFMAQYVAEARQGYADPLLRHEALEIADDFRSSDNDALDLAEGKLAESATAAEPWWR